MKCVECNNCDLNIIPNDDPNNSSCLVYRTIYTCRMYNNKIIPLPNTNNDCELFANDHYCNNCKHHKAILERHIYHRCDINGIIPEDRLFTHRDCKDFIMKEDK